jgi:cobalamin biosynthesis protein CobT
LSLTVPTIVEEKKKVSAFNYQSKKKKEAYFDICLDVSGSMAGSGIKCARLAMKRLIDHLIKTCGVPPHRITIYLYSTTCRTRRVGGDGADKWIDNIAASGGNVNVVGKKRSEWGCACTALRPLNLN